MRVTSLMPRCLTTAMLHGASRTTSSIVGEKTASVSRLPPDRPPQPKMIRSASSSAASSTMPSAARRPMRTTVRSSTPGGANSSTRCSRRRAWRALVAPSERGMPSGTSTMPSAVRMPPCGINAAPILTRSAAVRGLASGIRIRSGSWAFISRLSASVRRGTAWPAQRRVPGARRRLRPGRSSARGSR